MKKTLGGANVKNVQNWRDYMNVGAEDRRAHCRLTAWLNAINKLADEDAISQLMSVT